ETAGNPGKHAFAVVPNARDLAVHNASGPHHSTAECLADRLVAEAHPEDRDIRAESGNRTERNARFAGRAGAGRDDNTRGPEPGHGIQFDFVVAYHLDLRAQFGQVLHQVEGKRIVVVDHKEHATSAARNIAIVLCWVSSHSDCGSESATIPAAACTCSLPPFSTAVRIAIATSM